VTSSIVVLTITNVATVFTLQPTNQTVGVGSTVTFSVDGTAQLPFFLQWFKDGTNLVDGGSISGSTSVTLTNSDVQIGDSGTYWLVVSNAWGVLTSSNAVLTVLSAPSFTSIISGNGSNSFILSGVGGTNSGNYFVLTSTNLLTPLNLWTPVETNQFGNQGQFIFTNITSTNAPQQFYILQMP
jgi:hypothetical protein